MKVLVGHERSQKVTMALRKKGIEAYSCDVLPCYGGFPDWHLQMCVTKAIGLHSWDAAIFFPDCTYLCCSGLHWNKRVPGRIEKTEKALLHVQMLFECGIPKIALENPVGCISSRIRKASQYIQPYCFGADASKKTGLWLSGFPLLVGTEYVQPRLVNGVPRWGNQLDSGQNKLPPSDNRATMRSETYSGIAQAMADQWF